MMLNLTIFNSVCKSRADTSINTTATPSNFDIASETVNVEKGTNTATAKYQMKASIHVKDCILQMTVNPFAMFSSDYFSSMKYTIEYIRRRRRQQQRPTTSNRNIGCTTMKNKDDSKHDIIKYYDDDEDDNIDLIVSVWKEHLRVFIHHVSVVNEMKRDSLVSFRLLLCVQSLWLISFLTLFEMMQIRSWKYINVKDDWNNCYRLLLYICMEMILLFLVVKTHTSHRQPGPASTRIKGIEMKPYWISWVLEFIVLSNTMWITTYAVDVMDVQDEGAAIVLLFCMTFVSLFSIGMCLSTVCDINFFRDKNRREEVLKKVYDEIIAMNQDLTYLICDPIIRSYDSNIIVSMYTTKYHPPPK